MERNNVSQVLDLLITELRIPVTRKSIEEEIGRHPDYQSLLAISDLLNSWRIPNAAYQLSFEELIVAEVPVPFIAHLSKENRFVLVSQMGEKHVILSDEEQSQHKLNIEEFKDKYDAGSILIAEKEERSGEADYIVKQRKEKQDKMRIPFIISGSVLVFIVFLILKTPYITTFSLPIALLTLFKTVGIATSILLLIQSIDTNNPLIQKLCGGDNSKNCNAILSSKAAKVNDWLSWSEVGFFYFTGTMIMLLLGNSKSSLIQMLALLNLVSLPYTVYSIYYQWRVAKQWCIFCCAIQGILWLEFFTLIPFLQNGIQFPGLNELGSLFIGMSMPILIWMFIKPYLLLSKQIQPLKQQLRKFKYNADLFNKLLSEGAQYALPVEEHTLIIGNRDAEHIITMVSNPYCQPCSKAHKVLDGWLANRDDIKLQVVFSVHGNIDEDPNAKVAAHLMALQVGRNDVSLKHALDDWYEQKQKDYDSWERKHPATTNVPMQEALTTQQEWCKMTEIIGTPTIFINGRKLPDNYQPEDIKYFI